MWCAIAVSTVLLLAAAPVAIAVLLLNILKPISTSAVPDAALLERCTLTVTRILLLDDDGVITGIRLVTFVPDIEFPD